MKRFDFFFRQKVTEAELDAAFDAVEQAILQLMLDNGIVGITSGGQVTENAGTPNLTVDVAGPCTIYDQLGQRVSWSATQDVDCSVDENSNATAVTTPGNEKWLSIFAKFKRVYSDNRLDGEGATIQFSQAEGFEIHVVQGAEAVSATRPALRGDEILLDDVKLIYGQTQILNADIDSTRREDAFVLSASTLSIHAGQVEQALQAIATLVDPMGGGPMQTSLDMDGNNIDMGGGTLDMGGGDVLDAAVYHFTTAKKVSYYFMGSQGIPSTDGAGASHWKRDTLTHLPAESIVANAQLVFPLDFLQPGCKIESIRVLGTNIVTLRPSITLKSRDFDGTNNSNIATQAVVGTGAFDLTITGGLPHTVVRNPSGTGSNYHVHIDADDIGTIIESVIVTVTPIEALGA